MYENNSFLFWLVVWFATRSMRNLIETFQMHIYTSKDIETTYNYVSFKSFSSPNKLMLLKNDIFAKFAAVSWSNSLKTTRRPLTRGMTCIFTVNGHITKFQSSYFTTSTFNSMFLFQQNINTNILHFKQTKKQ